MQACPIRDDRVLWPTRAIAAAIVPFLLAGFAILYLLPDHTRQLFAWTLQPRASAMTLGAAYLGGAYFFGRAALSNRWHLVQAGFVPVALFAALMGLATVLHWDRFNHAHPTFAVWSAIYFTTPFLVLGAWLLNRGRDGGADSGSDALPLAGRRLLGAAGALMLLAGALFFADPAVAVAVWPWTLTPLSARVLAALVALAGAAQLTVALDRRGDAARVTLQSQLLSLAAIELAALLSWSDFATANPLTWAWVLGLPLLGALVTALLLRPRPSTGRA